MSAYVVNETHIDALVTAGLHLVSRGDTLRWFDGSPAADDETHAEGAAWGPGVGWYEAHKRELTRETAGRVGAMLLAENVRSVNYRYAEDEVEAPYVFNELKVGRIDPVLVLKVIGCYEYQACETPDWKTTEAHAFCEALRMVAIHALPGYDKVPAWDIVDPDVFR